MRDTPRISTNASRADHLPRRQHDHARSAPAPMADWSYRAAALVAALLLLATAGGAL